MKETELQHIVRIASDIVTDNPPVTRSARASAVRFAVLKRIETPDEMGISTFVKYGENGPLTESVREDMRTLYPQGRPDDVWDIQPEPDDRDWSRFRVELDDVSDAEARQIDRVMAAIGAWKVGIDDTTPLFESEAHYLWDEDHPVVGLVPKPEIAEETDDA